MVQILFQCFNFDMKFQLNLGLPDILKCPSNAPIMMFTHSGTHEIIIWLALFVLVPVLRFSSRLLPTIDAISRGLQWKKL